jgi:hypothetical protein
MTGGLYGVAQALSAAEATRIVANGRVRISRAPLTS